MLPRTIALGVGLMLLVGAGPASASPGNGAHQLQEPLAHCDDGTTRLFIHPPGQWGSAYDPLTGRHLVTSQFELTVTVLASPSENYPPPGAVLFDGVLTKNKWSEADVRCTINYQFEAEPGFWLDVDSAVSGQFRP
jgi:hypothetical protein